MLPRINLAKTAPAALEAMRALERHINQSSGLEPALRELVKTRASQLNGCAYCIDMHTKEAREAGETEQRLYALDAWRETPFYTDRERAALEWTEAITLIGKDHAPDELFVRVRQFFSEQELVNLTLAIVSINGWNRLMIAFRTVPGTYQPKPARTGATGA